MNAMNIEIFNSMKENPKLYCNFLEYKSNTLEFEGIDCSKLAEKYGTPLYCYSYREIKNNYRKFKDAVSSFKSSIFYAVKANFNPSIIKLLAKEGAGADVVSKGEIELSLSAGIKPNKIVFSGVGKSQKDIVYAMKKKIFQINVESYEELKEIEEIQKNYKKKKNIDISLRVNPNVDAKTHKKISTGKSEDKFGIPSSKIIQIFNEFKNNKFIKISGLAIHIGSQITNIEPFEDAFRKLRKLVLQLKREGHNLKKLDLGGGIGIVYSNNNTIKLSDYTNSINRNFGDLKLDLLFEPGRSLIGSAGILISRVIRNKKGLKNDFLIIDSGMNDLIRPSMYDSYHNVIPVKRKKNSLKLYDIEGPICETGDSFGKNRKLQNYSKDDLLVLCSVGAYGSSMSSYYNCRIPADEIIINNGKVIKTKKKIKPQKLYLKA